MFVVKFGGLTCYFPNYSVLKHCSVDRLSRLSVQQLEILSQEKHLDQVIYFIQISLFLIYATKFVSIEFTLNINN